MRRSESSVIRLRGVRHNNLKNFDLDLPLKQLIVITGLSGSGKSSLAFDTLFAEGQRRYVETFSPYARQFFDRMDKPQVDLIDGIPPAIAIEQKNSVKSTRSTVGTMTEICDYARLLWFHCSTLYCRSCRRPVRKDSPAEIWKVTSKSNQGGTVLVTFEVKLSDKLSLPESLKLIGKQGFQRLLVGDRIVHLSEAEQKVGKNAARLTIIQDRIDIANSHRARFIEACEHAYHFGQGQLTVIALAQGKSEATKAWKFSNRLHCAECDLEYREPTPSLFSFNHPGGACPTCRGFGRVITIDYDRAIPDHSCTLSEGAVKPWRTGQSAESQKDLVKACRTRKVPTNIPFEKLSPEHQRWVVDGDVDYGKDPKHEWPHAWYGVKGYFRWLESKAYKMHVRVLLSRYRAYTRCPVCEGRRFQPDTLLYSMPAFGSNDAGPGLTLSEFYQLSIGDAFRLVDKNATRLCGERGSPLELAVQEVRSRLGYLVEVGLSYLTLDRATRSLSGGETERVNLTTCLGSRLVNTLFVLDEPSVGLHARDIDRLVRILEQLRNAGNTVVVVEHEGQVMKAADQIIDLGPGHGESGGKVIFQGSYEALLENELSLTGAYLKGVEKVERPGASLILRDRAQSLEKPKRCLILRNASQHNLKNITVEIPLGRLVVISGVSGSGKTTLIRDVLVPLLQRQLVTPGAGDITETDSDEDEAGDLSNVRRESSIEGSQHISSVILVDQSAIGKTPRSNPAVYIGAFDHLRDLFAETAAARQQGFSSSSFSFNSAQGQCERCRGAGFEKIEMQFLSDVFIRCPECNGRRYREEILRVRLDTGSDQKRPSIAEVLEMTANEAIHFLASIQSKPALQTGQRLRLLERVGLGYLKLGQPINTLSGGESQRLKLVRHLVDSPLIEKDRRSPGVDGQGKAALFVFDEPTTGLHFHDVKTLLAVFHEMVESGHSVVVIEHHLDVIRNADWIIDLGPEGGEEGGRVVATGRPADVMRSRASHTASALRDSIPNEGEAVAVGLH